MKKFFKKSVLIFILLFLVLSGCKSSKNQTALNNIKTQLETDISFKISYEYMNLAVDGFSQVLEQNSAKDGSFSFTTTYRQWNHQADFDTTEKMEYFYRYENDVYVCYMKKDGGETSREELSKNMQTELETQKARIVSYNALFPSYLEKFSEKVADEKYTFRLPVDKIIEDDNYLAAYLENVFRIRNIEYDSQWDVDIICTCITEKDTYKPIKITYDFKDLKPYVLSSGALSGEAAFDTEFMKLTYELNYDIPQSIEKPDIFK